MSDKDNGGPAFPFAATDPSNVSMQAPGMSLRDWVMGQCIAASFGMPDAVLDRAPGESLNDALSRHWGRVAKAAAAAADAMIEARK